MILFLYSARKAFLSRRTISLALCGKDEREFIIKRRRKNECNNEEKV
jgi:hypothetical protein